MSSTRSSHIATTSNTNRYAAFATAWMTTAALLFAVMALLAKATAARLPGPEVAFVRFVCGLGAVGLRALHTPLRPHYWRGLALRGVLGGAAVLTYFIAIAHLDVGLATLLQYTQPVFTALWAWLFLSEALTASTLLALVVTTIGVALVIAGRAPAGVAALGPWPLVGLGSSVLSGAAVATIREVRKHDGAWEIFCAFCLVGALVTAPPAALDWVQPTTREWLLLTAMGLVAVVAQLMMTQALRDLPAATAGVLFQLTPVATLLLGRLLYGERASLLALVGAGVTIGGVSYGAWSAATSSKRAAP